VPQGGARFRFQVMASHTREDIDQVVAILARAMREADLEYRLGHEGQQDTGRARTATAAA